MNQIRRLIGLGVHQTADLALKPVDIYPKTVALEFVVSRQTSAHEQHRPILINPQGSRPITAQLQAII